jgi:hypothetical protein
VTPPADTAETAISPEEAAVSITAINADKEITLATIAAETAVAVAEEEHAARVESAEAHANEELEQWKARALAAEATLSTLAPAVSEEASSTSTEPSEGELPSETPVETLAEAVGETATDLIPQSTSEETSETRTEVTAVNAEGDAAQAVVATAPAKGRVFIL